MEPTIFECACWVAIGVGALIFLLASFMPWNEKYDPKGDDPYRHCPKEEE